jgi:predicted nucleotidyltransferase
MRLQPFERESIRSIARQIFGEGTKVTLFGSRVHDTMKGGDIDLYVRASDNAQAAAKKIDFLVALKLALGDQKIDVVIAKDQSLLIEQEAMNNGVEL